MEIQIDAAVAGKRVGHVLCAMRIVACTVSVNYDVGIWQVNDAVGVERRAWPPIVVDSVGQARVLIQGHTTQGLPAAVGGERESVAPCPLPFGKLIELA